MVINETNFTMPPRKKERQLDQLYAKFRKIEESFSLNH